jgi:hypothetical protein
VDNWYSSPALFKFLFEQNTCAVELCNLLETVCLCSKKRPTDATARWHVMVVNAVIRNICMPNYSASRSAKEDGKSEIQSRVKVLQNHSVLEYDIKIGVADHIDMQDSFVEMPRKSLT